MTIACPGNHGRGRCRMFADHQTIYKDGPRGCPAPGGAARRVPNMDVKLDLRVVELLCSRLCHNGGMSRSMLKS